MKWRSWIGILWFCWVVPSWSTNGHFLSGVGPTNEAMGGAGTGVAGTDTVGTVHLNPAGSAMFEEGLHLDLSGDWFIPDRTVSSRANEGAFGPGFPPFSTEGSTRSETGDSLLPAFGLIWKPQGSDTAYHLGMMGIAGFGVDYAGESFSGPSSNPILTPQPPGGFGFGGISSEYQLLKLSVGASRKLTERFSIGYSLIGGYSRLKVSPAPFAVPDDANRDGFFSYPNATGFADAFGFGFQVGTMWEIDDRWSLGLTGSSPIWFEDFHWHSSDEAGNPRRLTFNLDFPAWAGIGIGYRPTPSTLLALDVRRIFYSSTDGFDDYGFRPDGSVKGFGWEDITVFGVGLEKRVDSRTKFRIGYNYNENPIPSSLSFFNTPAPAIVQHRVSVGIARKLRENLWMNLTYYHAFRESISGPYWTPDGPVEGTDVRSRLSEDSLSLGFSWHF